MPTSRTFRHRILAATIATLLAAPLARAATLNWNSSATLWDDTTPSWLTGGFTSTAWVPDSDGRITGNFAITVVGTQRGDDLRIDGTTSLTGGTLEFSSITVPGGANPVTIASSLVARDVGGGGLLTLATGNALLSLTGASTLGGALTISGGNVTLTGAGASLAATTFSIGNASLSVTAGAALSATTANVNSTLVLDGAGTSAAFGSTFVSGAMTVNAGANFSTTGVLVSTGAFTLSGATSTVGSLQADHNGTNVALVSGSALTVLGDARVGMSGPGVPGKVAIGAGSTLDLRGDLILGTSLDAVVEILNGGTLKVSGGDITSPGGVGGRLRLEGGSRLQLGANLFSGAPIRFENTGAGLPVFDTNGFDGTLLGPITQVSGVAFEKQGAGILKLAGNNDYGAIVGTIIKGGLIEWASRTNLGIQTANPSTRRIQFDGGGLRWAVGNTDDISAWFQSTSAAGAVFDTGGNNVTFATSTGYSTSGGPITKTGAGTLTLTATTTRVGATNVTGGTLSIDNLNKVGSGPVSLSTGGRLASSGGLTLSNTVSVATGGQLAVTGVLILNNTTTLDGAGSAVSGTTALEFAKGTTASLTITGGGVVSAATTLAAGMAGGTGTVSVTGAGSSLTAGTDLHAGLGGAGTITVGGGGAVTAGALYFAQTGGSGVFHLNPGGTLNVGGIIGGGGPATFNFAGGTLRANASFTTSLPMTLSNAPTVDTNGFNLTQNGALSGSSALTKIGAGMLVLNVANSYSGGTLVTGGALRVSAASSLGSGAVVVNGGAQLQASANFSGNPTISLDGTDTLFTSVGFMELGVAGGTGSLSATNGARVSAGTSFALAVTPGSSGTLTVSGAGARLDVPSTFHLGFAGNGAFTVGNGAVAKAAQFVFGQSSGVGTLTLQPGGTVEVGGANGLFRAGGATFNFAGGTLRVVGANLTGNVPLTLSATSTLDTNGFNAALSGALGGGGALTKIGAGTLTLTGASSIGGNFVANGGAVALTAGSLASGGFVEVGSTGAASLAVSGGADLSSATSVAFGVQPGVSGSASVTGAGSTLTAATTLFAGVLGNGGVNVGAGGVITAGVLNLGTQAGGSGTFDLNTGGQLNVGGADGIVRGAGSGAFNLAGGTLKITAASLTTSVPMTLTNLSLIDTSGVNAVLGGALSGTGGLAKTGGGTLSLNTPNTYAGGTSLFAGQIVVPAATSLGTGAIAVSGGNLHSTGTFSRDVTITVDGASSSLTAASFIEIGGGGTGSLAVTNGAQVSTPSSVAFAVLPGGTSGFASVTGAGATLSAGTTMFLGFQGSGTVTVGSGGTVSVGGQLVLGSIASGAGAFNLNPGGTLNIGGADGIARGDGTATFNLAGGVLKVTGASLTTTVPMTLTNTTLIDTSGVSGSLHGVLNGPGGLAKTGAGTLTLGAPNTYAGPTTVIAGTLALGAAGALPDASPISLQGGTLTANGIQETAGTLQLAVASVLDFSGGDSTFAFANSSALAWNDTLTITGFTLGADTLRFGTDATGLTGAQLGLLRFADYGNATGVIDSLGYVTIPEPGSALLALTGLALLARRRPRASAL